MDEVLDILRRNGDITDEQVADARRFMREAQELTARG
jgi:hypothetical protein